jgi:hypothetical protein
MRILSFLALCFILCGLAQKSDSPHGKNFSVSCSTCHSSKGWDIDKSIYSFNHNKTNFALTGQHLIVKCRQCHPSLVFSEAKGECNICHQDIHQGTTGLDCGRCHTSSTWLVHNVVTLHDQGRFPLLGAHRTADCSDCHKSENGLRFDTPGVNCIDCHRQDYLSTTNPDHVKSGMSEDCSLCHGINAQTWSHGGFDHSIFPLAQGHGSVRCTQCHTTGNYTDASPECYSCHQNDYMAAKAPDHSGAQFSTVCTMCHTLAAGWKPAAFDHSFFPLTLGHSTALCTQCHVGGNYTSVPTDCYSCHQTDFTASTNPNHTAAGFSTQCQTCHTTTPGWKPATFNHNIFPLTLGHATPTCSQCHTGNNYTTTPTDCYACHAADFSSTNNPNHATAGFPQTCQTCHTTNPGWAPSSYNHNSFPLTLGHSGVACNTCHVGGNYNALPTACFSCHAADYNGTTNPNHQSLAFSTTCTQCHTTNPGWTPASYDHGSFPLTLGHSGLTCAACHVGGNYNITTTACYSCHAADYNGTTNPNHQTLAFSTTCTNCHTTNPGWQPASYTQHDSQFFPIYSGRHNGVWSLCSDCHTDAANYTTFNCIRCHADAHRNQNYTNSQCYNCHPQGVAN